MIKLIYLYLIIATIAFFIVAALEGESDWLEYREKFNKTYSPAEEEYRKQVFFENLKYIKSHNTKSGSSFTQGINPLSDLTTDEIIRTRCGFRFNETEHNFAENGCEIGFLKAFEDRAWFEDSLSPTSLDWRTQGRVSKVKDQGNCGSCWAFATTGALEGLLAARNQSALLSEQNLVDCSGKYGNHGCSGGLMDLALKYVRDHGIMASHEYPYAAKNGECKFKKESSVLKVRGSILLPRGNEAALRVMLALFGPIPVAIDAGKKSFHSYKSGIYNDETCKNSRKSLNHAVLLVGYGTDNDGRDYWIVKNSWGNKWGELGYVRLARNQKNLCGVASYAVLPIP